MRRFFNIWRDGNLHTLLKRITCASGWASANRTVVNHLAAGLQAASCGARIYALLVDTGLKSGALAGHHTLGSTLRRSSNVSRQAGAHGMSINVAALAVGAAGRWVAGLHNGVLHDWLHAAVGERISFVSLKTGAHRDVVKYFANGVVATNARAWIHAAVSHAGLVTGTVGRKGALWTAALERIALIVVLATALSVETVGVGTAWVGIAWVCHHWRLLFWFLGASHKRIAFVAFNAVADGQVVQNMALGLEAARS